MIRYVTLSLYLVAALGLIWAVRDVSRARGIARRELQRREAK